MLWQNCCYGLQQKLESQANTPVDYRLPGNLTAKLVKRLKAIYFTLNKPFPRCLLFLSQNKSWCTTFHMEINV